PQDEIDFHFAFGQAFHADDAVGLFPDGDGFFDLDAAQPETDGQQDAQNDGGPKLIRFLHRLHPGAGHLLFPTGRRCEEIGGVAAYVPPGRRGGTAGGCMNSARDAAVPPRKCFGAPGSSHYVTDAGGLFEFVDTADVEETWHRAVLAHYTMLPASPDDGRPRARGGGGGKPVENGLAGADRGGNGQRPAGKDSELLDEG